MSCDGAGVKWSAADPILMLFISLGRSRSRCQDSDGAQAQVARGGSCEGGDTKEGALDSCAIPQGAYSSLV